MLQEFAETLEVTACEDQLSLTEIIIGIDIDDVVCQNDEAKDRLTALMPCRVVVSLYQNSMVSYVVYGII